MEHADQLAGGHRQIFLFEHFEELSFAERVTFGRDRRHACAQVFVSQRVRQAGQATDRDGRSLESGVYFFRIDMNGTVNIRKIVLMR